MRKEYHKLFKGKYLWAYNPSADKGGQRLISFKYASEYYYWYVLNHKGFPDKIIQQFKRDVDRFFAKLEFEKMSEQLANPWTDSVSGIRFAARSPMIFKTDKPEPEILKSYICFKDSSLHKVGDIVKSFLGAWLYDNFLELNGQYVAYCDYSDLYSFIRENYKYPIGNTIIDDFKLMFQLPDHNQIKQPEEKPMTLKLEVYEAANKEEDKVLRLKLKKDNSGDVILCAVDDKGNLIEGGSIVYISKNGKLVKCANVSNSLGLTTKQGQIVISGEFE